MFFISQSVAPEISVENEESLSVQSLQFGYKIYNNGPSTIKELVINMQIPMIYMSPQLKHIQLIDVDRVRIKGYYINKLFEWTNRKESDENDEFIEISTEALEAFDQTEVKYKASMHHDKDHQILKNLRSNQTIFFNCSKSAVNIACTSVELSIHNFEPGSDPISMNLHFPVDLTKARKFVCIQQIRILVI